MPTPGSVAELHENAPRLRPQDALDALADLYGLRGSASPLPSERDQNWLIQTDSGERYVFKIANRLESRALLEAQNQALAHLWPRFSLCQRVIPTPDGQTIARIRSGPGQGHYVRLVTYLEGTPLGRLRRQTPELLGDLGRCLGRLDRALADFDHPALHREFHWDLAHGLGVVRQYASLIAAADLRPTVADLVDRSQSAVETLLPRLPRSVIHNDANDFNVLVGGGDDLYRRNQQVTGLLDFGDMVYSYTVADLAVAAAYALLDKPDPLAAAASVVQGYHAERPLTEDEIAALYGLICLRLCLSVGLAAHQQRQRPDNAYLAVSQGAIGRTLPRLARIPPGLAGALFRSACDLPPLLPARDPVRWLESHAGASAPILEADLRAAPVLALDLSPSSPLIEGDPAANKHPALTDRIWRQIDAAGAALAIGRYGQPRLEETGPADWDDPDASGEPPTIHLGVDLFAQTGTPVHAPLAGTVHTFAPDAGRTLILEHAVSPELTFYTLYRYLSPAPLGDRPPGTAVERGQVIGTVAGPDENGGRPPHLHFQLVADLLDLDARFPAACRPAWRAVWQALSPDPNLLLGIPADRLPAPPPDRAATLAARRRLIGPNLSLAYRRPLKIVRGWMQYLIDQDGRRYLDAYNNVPHVGHCHPRVVEAGRRQMGLLNTNTRYLHDLINRYAGRLCATLPDPLRVCFFVNSGSEANELALRLARAHTGQRDLIVLEAAYHGHTTGLIDISPYKHGGPGGSGPPDWVHTAPIADDYRGPYRRDDPQAGVKYAAHVQTLIEELQQHGRGLCGFIAESWPSVGGQIAFPAGYLAAVYRAVRQAGGVCIADEVQTGLGRLGAWFWGFEAQAVVPDVVVLGKPIGNGHPVAAVITSRAIATSFDNGMEFFSTFGGNPVSCAIGLAVLDVVEEERLQEHARQVGHRLLAGLWPLVDRYRVVGDVRGSGLFLGVELVRDRRTLEPAAEEASFVVNRLAELGILLGTDGPYHNVLKIRPPMPFSTSDADRLVAALDQVLAADLAEPP